MVKSPVTGEKSKLVKIIKTDYIESLYKISLNYNVHPFFNTDTISLYRCCKTGYKFYYPLDIKANNEFYQNIENFDWYYQTWKWDYDKAITEINLGDNVLEVGCGRGYFLSELQKRGNDVVGVELNENAIEFAKQNNIKVLNTSLDEIKDEKFDVICSFQVLEHINNVENFITDCCRLLKTNGKLIFTVPNNDAFFFKSNKLIKKSNESYINQLQTVALNMPPHHMGLWNLKSLKKMQKVFPLQVICIDEETNNSRNFLNNQILRDRYPNKYIRKVFQMLYRRSLKRGDSIFVVYKKLS